MAERRRIDALPAAFHVGKIVAERRDPALAEAVRRRLDKFLAHPGSRAMPDDVDRAGLRGRKQEARDAVVRINGEADRLGGVHHAHSLAN